MKYIVWDLISPYDGFDRTTCDTWEDVQKIIQARCFELKIEKNYDRWSSGKISIVTKTGDHNVYLFVTTEPITLPITDK